MGDNRDNSSDSRIAVSAGGVGLLPVGDLVGRVDALVGSWDLAVRHQRDDVVHVRGTDDDVAFECSGKVDSGFPTRTCFTKKIERPIDSI